MIREITFIVAVMDELRDYWTEYHETTRIPHIEHASLQEGAPPWEEGKFNKIIIYLIVIFIH
jgi:hypothetical protein